ncbi:MAG: M24 family metallopeptidase [Phycisphaerae bacterium]
MGNASTKRPSAVIAARLARCRRDMRRHGVGAYLVTRLRDAFYLTGFTGEDSAVLVTSRSVHIISDARFDESINNECPWARKWLRQASLTDEIGYVCRRLKLGSIAVQADHMTLADHTALKKSSRPIRIVTAPPIVSNMRRIKDPTELVLQTKAIRVAEAAFLAVRSQIRVGQTEEALAGLLEYEMRRRGASAAAFGTICAEGAHAALPHAVPGRRKVKRGSAILFDWGARVGWYCSDLTRVVFVSSMPPKIRDVYRVVLDAQVRAIDAIKPGARMCDVDAVARQRIADAGFGNYFGHGLGHGLGLSVHEPPSLSRRSRERLEAGMVVTVEPGIYLPGQGGVRIEDDVLVTRRGCRVLSRLGKGLEDVVI